MVLVAPQSVSAGRDELLWEEELARVRAGCHLLAPAAAAAVQSVLSSILDEPDQNGDLRSVLALFQEVRSETAHATNTAPNHAAPLGR